MTDGDSGTLVNFFDAEAIAGAVAHVLQTPDMHRAPRHSAIRYAQANFSVHSAIEAYRVLLR
ncbi:hypothetical protein [Massilia sp. TSP1-1-2]|uniref:hypothetical protein n=1 Tax=Massilia sp. TSP1-1-2 TaxID=2804649 RepID=UPI003CEEEB48